VTANINRVLAQAATLELQYPSETRERGNYVRVVRGLIAPTVGYGLAAVLSKAFADEGSLEQFAPTILAACAYACRIRGGDLTELAARLSLEAERLLHEEVRAGEARQ
jgi:hypothetical protein